jgi:2-dehydropantoate 2-reductase
MTFIPETKEIKPIKKVSLIGLGALGVMYSQHISEKLPFEDFRIIVDEERKNRYLSEGIFSNGEECNFHYVTPEEEVEAADLLIFSVKYMHLQEAIQSVAKHIGKDTIILSVLNGIVSESDIAKVYGSDHLLYCVAQGMTALKVENRLTFVNKGMLCFGELNEVKNTEKVQRVKAFFDKIDLTYEINNQMQTKLWSKLLANVGINQTLAYFESPNKGIQDQGHMRDMMIEAMKEVLEVAKYEDVDLSYKDIVYWLKIFDSLEPDGMPSMAQDIKANRPTEIQLFAGTIVKLAAKHGIFVPVNEKFYEHFLHSSTEAS